MRNKCAFSSLAFAIAFFAIASIFSYAQPGNPQYRKGFPSRDGSIDIRAGFANPPKGYGNVPFFWWSGDILRIDRLKEELELLSDSPTDGFAVSYNHTNAEVDSVVNAAGHGPYGLAEYGTPKAFSDQWWKIWNEFSGFCADKGLGAGMDDYVFSWPGNHDYMDEVTDQLKGYQGKLKSVKLAVGSELPENVLQTYPVDSDSLLVIYTIESPELHPDFGKVYIEKYFQRFEDHLDAHGRDGMNYFFQDELTYNPDIHSWSEDMPEQFFARKGYDIVPHLAALFEDKGEESIKTRLDYADVVTSLAEERFFKPIYDWNESRGLIYGCDNLGRGLDPIQYMDYFKEVSWFTAPGNDAPARGSSFTQTKVSSSIAHMYDRPRTWLEAFHSMGWDANGAVLTHQLDHHIIAGGNLLCMHGLYYSTHGGWWEWAPPSFHFRMPYWEHMKLWLKYAERLCFVLSQGRHVCDIAVLYPTETLQAIPGTNGKLALEMPKLLSPAGYDFDYIDFRSLQKAELKDGVLNVSGERYPVLILADIQAVHDETARVIEAFSKAGGTVISIGKRCTQIDPDCLVEMEKDEITSYLKKTMTPDFSAQSGEGRVLHRHVGDRDVYMVMDIAKGDSIFFRSHGKIEEWNAKSGEITEIPALKVDADGTWLRFDSEKGASKLIVFSPGKPSISSEVGKAETKIEDHPLDGDWDVTILPTMNNKWGDFRLPASDEYIGVEARSMKSAFISKKGKVSYRVASKALSSSEYDAVYGYGPFMLTSNGNDTDWRPYEWSWQFGVFNSPGSQGYHGLKGKVDSRFLILDQGCDQYFKTYVLAPADGTYKIIKEGVSPDLFQMDGKDVSGQEVSLSAGWHELKLCYKATEKVDYSLKNLVGSTVDNRKRSMVMFYPGDAPEPKACDPYGPIICSKWYGTDFLSFSAFGEEMGQWAYRFDTAPGTKDFSTEVDGTVSSIYIDGRPAKFTQEGTSVKVKIPAFNSGISTVTVIASPSAGVLGSAFFTEPVKMHCEGGKMKTGDWTQNGAMRYYSGGVLYRHGLEVDNLDGRWILDLGDVDATCEVSVNGKKVDVLLSIPYSVDVTGFLHEGKNTVEVLVYSSLANHYQTIPTPYQGTPHAGLIGPVVMHNEL